MAKTGKHQQPNGAGLIVQKTRSSTKKELNWMHAYIGKIAKKYQQQKDKEDFPNIICYGTFDLFHFGHARLLKRASKLGEKLIIGLSTDAFNKKKGKTSVQTYKQRKEVIEMLDCVDMVIPERNWKQKGKDMALFRARIVMGSDHKGKFDEYGCIYLPRTKGISSTKLKETL